MCTYVYFSPDLTVYITLTNFIQNSFDKQVYMAITDPKPTMKNLI